MLQSLHRVQIVVAASLLATTVPAMVPAQAGMNHDMTGMDCAKAAMPADHANMNHAAMEHAAQSSVGCDTALPTAPPQAAYAVIAEVVRLLRADSTTDWSQVNIEALRQHLIDMDDVVIRSTISQRNIPGGLVMTVTGAGRTTAAIRRMAPMHAAMLQDESGYHASAVEVPGGVRLTVTAGNPSDTRAVQQLRALGFAGLLTEGDHHAKHHMMIARGQGMEHAH